jgi:hypothetical protein
MAKQLDKKAIFNWLQNGAASIQKGLAKGVQKTQEVKEKVNQKIEEHPKVKALRDQVNEFAHNQSEKIQDFRIHGTRIGDLPNAAQKMTERQLLKLMMRLREVNPNFDWNQFLPDPQQMPIFEAFDQLELPYDTPFEEVKKKYRQLMREYHPDRHSGSPEAEQAATQKTQQITAAYELIEKHYGK